MTMPQENLHALLLERCLSAQLLSLQLNEITIDEAIVPLVALGMSANEALVRLSTAPVDEMFPLEFGTAKN